MTEIQETAWLTFANTNNLTFSIDQGPQIEGTYRKHQVKIQALELDYQAYTQIILSINNSGAEPLVKRNTGYKVVQAEAIKRLIMPDILLQSELKGEIKIKEEGQRVVYEQFGIEENIQYLQFLLDLLADLANNYASIIATGGEAISALQEIATGKSFRDIATQLLLGIGRETTSRFSDRVSRIFCPYCFVQFDRCEFSLLRWKRVTYYGCRTCSQSRRFFEGRIIAVLDNRLKRKNHQDDGILYVNWLELRTLFDFNEVRIVQADDEDVERFIVQLGNDTDPFRNFRYRQAICTVSSGCNLSENSMRILRQTFESVGRNS